MSRAWTFQDSRAKKKLGTKAPWSVGWIDPEGGRRSKKIGSESLAKKYARKLEGQLAAGIYQGQSRKQWPDFRAEYEAKILSGAEPGTREVTLQALAHFQRIIGPRRMEALKTQTIDAYVARRRQERGRKQGDTVSPCTINKELRHIKAVLNVAHDWGYLPAVPKVRMLREPKKAPRYVTPNHFAVMYEACNAAKLPKNLPYLPRDWWQALLTFNYMTGWRVGEPLALRWDDVSLDKGVVTTQHADNKGRRGEHVPIHPIAVEHLRRLVDASIEWPVVFPWFHHRRSVWSEFGRIQQAAGIDLPCREKHVHTPACHLYGFHDLRRAFATQNAEKLSADALQALMRHKSYTTTQGYVNMARQINRSVEKLYVPEVLRQNEN